LYLKKGDKIMQLKNWSDIANEFQDTLVLGNGASISIDQRFDYRSLLQKARELAYNGTGSGNSQLSKSRRLRTSTVDSRICKEC